MSRLHLLYQTETGPITRSTLENVNLAAGMSDLKKVVGKELNLDPSEFDLIYRGQRLSDLGSAPVRSGHTLCVQRKASAEAEAAATSGTGASFGSRDYAVLLQGLRSVVTRSGAGFRAQIEAVTQQEDFLSRMLAQVPGLAADPFSMNVLRDPELLFTFLEMHEKVAPEHPALYRAAQLIVEQMRKQPGAASAAASGTYAMDAMDDEEHEAGFAPPSLQVTPGPAAGGISASDLQAALALAVAIPQRTAARPGQQRSGASAAGGVGSRVGAPSTGAPSGTAQSDASISSDMLQHALVQATTGAFTDQLRQMHELGIVDDVRAIRCLQLADGDVQAALELMFSED